MDSKVALALVALILLVPFAHAQSTNLQPLWDAISNLGAAIQTIQQDIQTIQTVGLQFAQEVSTRLNDLESQVTTIQEVGTQVILDMNGQITTLHATDENLQAQINGIGGSSLPTYNRNNIYEVVGSGLATINLYCQDANDILLNSYCAGGFIGDNSETLGLVSDSFSDGEYLSDPTWHVFAGNWDASSTALVGGYALGGSIYTNTSMLSNREYHISLKIKQNNPGTYGAFKWYTTSPAYNSDGYDLAFNDNGNIYLTKWSNSSLSNLLNLGSFQSNLIYDVNIIHYTNGLIELFINGNLSGSITETTYSSGTMVSFWTGNNPGVFTFDDLLITYVDSNAAPSGFLNINNPNSPMGIRCNNGWEARILCYQQ